MNAVPIAPTAPYGAFLLRLALGLMWLSHALVLKLLTFGIPGLSAWLGSVGLPPAMAWPLVVVETAGGLLVLLGWHGRWASLALLPILLGATVLHWPNGWVFTAPNGGWEYPVFLALASLAHVLVGDGALALDGRASGEA